MKIHLNQIPVHGLHIEGEEEENILDFQDHFARPAGRVQYQLDIGLSDGGLFATGSLEVDMEFECVTCMEWFRKTLSIPDFALQVELDGREWVDLTDDIREDILLALPPHPHCDRDGGKACTGVRQMTLEKEADPSLASPNDPDSEKGNPWATLDALDRPEQTNP